MAIMPTSTFWAFVGSDNSIYRHDMQGSVSIGITNEAHAQTVAELEEAISKAEKLYDLCVQGGLITPEPTQDQVLKTLVERLDNSDTQNRELMGAVMELSKQVAQFIGIPEPSGQVAPLSPAPQTPPEVRVEPKGLSSDQSKTKAGK